ncbi:HAD family hydrolase [Sinomonas atrocyanea]|uniref:HAD family hydrolase n=1 Tax=Sinomonas atrocyanea TaxID=37927 RepID=A0A126ZXI8_9MICC|nr:HAD-IA family hydrolase [Sinomonas atrocyanea]AMM31890.1 HAD family hydrolase [Sinomonas atrocyanea]GEB66000.1 hydrolase [Sinomonas atrocyanea]GGG78634.1 hydrolase [Sinomonas atrocyanea]
MTFETVSARAVLLDMDGTLVNSDAVVERLWAEWAAEQGLAWDTVEPLIHGRQGWLTMSLLLPERAHAANLADEARMLDASREDTAGVVPVPGAAELLAALAGIPHALVTSADDDLARRRMAAAGLPFPELAVTAEMVAASKPDPEGFLLAASKLGAPAAECLVLEDSEAGIMAGLAAGARVLGVGGRAASYAPTYWVPDLTAVTLERADDGAALLMLAG